MTLTGLQPNRVLAITVILYIVFYHLQGRSIHGIEHADPDDLNLLDGAVLVGFRGAGAREQEDEEQQ